MAEASVRFAETWIIAALRDRKFFSIREMNEAIAEKLEELNDRPFKRMTGTRRSAYLVEEKSYMLPLPAMPFEAAVRSVAKVPNDYLVSDGRNKYSVPYDNPWLYAWSGGFPMGLISALRFDQELREWYSTMTLEEQETEFDRHDNSLIG